MILYPKLVTTEHFIPNFEHKNTVYLKLNTPIYCTNINHKGLQRTAKEYAEERRIYKDLISKNEKKTY